MNLRIIIKDLMIISFKITIKVYTMVRSVTQAPRNARLLKKRQLFNKGAPADTRFAELASGVQETERIYSGLVRRAFLLIFPFLWCKVLGEGALKIPNLSPIYPIW